MAARYGPHDPSTAPTAVTVRCGALTSYCAAPRCRQEHQVDLPVLLARQREQVNNRAHKEASTH